MLDNQWGGVKYRRIGILKNKNKINFKGEKIWIVIYIEWRKIFVQ